MDEIKFFRDQYKNPDLYPVDPSEMNEIKEATANRPLNKGKKKQTKDSHPVEGNVDQKTEHLHTSLAENYRTVIKMVREMSLKDEFKDDLREGAILITRKEIILRTLQNITKDIEEYIGQINYLKTQNKSGYDDVNQYQANVGSSDAVRRSCHNKLINDLKLAIKWINVSFNQDFPNDLRVQEESKLADRQGQSKDEVAASLNKRNYVQFPMGLGVIINKDKMPRDPQSEREYIMHWAFEFYDDLSKLNNFLANKEDRG